MWVNKFGRKWIRRIYLFSLIALVFLPLATKATNLSDLERRLKSAQQELSRYQSLQNEEAQKSDLYTAQIATEQKNIASISASIVDLRRSIDGKTTEIAQTESDIQDATAKLNSTTTKLNNSIVNIYIFTSQSTSVMLMQHATIAEYSEHQEYSSIIEQNLGDDIAKADMAKKQYQAEQVKLEKEQSELKALKGIAESKVGELTVAQNQSQSLLDQSRRRFVNYKATAAQLTIQQNVMSQQIYALRAKLSTSNKETYLGSSSGYPFTAIDVADPWGFYTRECTSYAAWKWNTVYRKPFYNTGNGNAWNWPVLARDQGYTVSATPKVGAIATWDRNASMPYGHTAIVESVNIDGTINISEYNWQKFAFSYRLNVRYLSYGSVSFIY